MIGSFTTTVHTHFPVLKWCEWVNVFSSLQRLCDYVCDLLLEESNVQPVSTPVTVCGDIHGQVRAQEHKV